MAPEIQESHEKQWKTIKNKGNEKKWSCKWKKRSLMAKGDEQKWKNMKIKWKNDNGNDNENENGNENENEKIIICDGLRL